MENYKSQLILAIKSIDEKHFRRNERDFSYELYHKLRVLDLDIDVTAETPKGSHRIPAKLMPHKFFKKHFFISENYDVINNNYNRTPDLLFHQYGNRDKQLLACEIKPVFQANRLICKDLAKLLYYTESNLRYQKGILILFSTDGPERKLTQLKAIFEQSLLNFPKIEVWIASPKRLHIVWAEGRFVDETC
jgi:hypothetical protein